MLRPLRVLVALLLVWPAPASAQEPTVQLETRGTSGTITANGGAVTLTNIGSMATLAIQTTGTFSLTWELQCAVDGVTFDADDEIPVTLVSSTPTPADSVTTNVEGIYTANVAGFSACRVIATAYTSGTLAVTMTAITSGGGSGGGGGSASSVSIAQGGNTAQVVATASGALQVSCVSGCSGSGGTSIADDAAFTVGTTSTTPAGGIYRATKDLVDDGDAGAFAMNIRRGLYVTSDNVTSTANSTAVNLAGAAAFTGTSEDVTDYAQIQVSVFSSHASATNGLSLQQSSDGTNWDITDTYTVAATTPMIISVPVQAKFYRLVYTNGGTLTTSLRIQSVFKVSAGKGSSQRPADAMSNENDFDQSLSYLMGFNGTGWDRLRTANTGFLSVQPFFAGTAASTGVGASGAQTQRVVTATDSSIASIGTSVTPGTAAANLGKAEDAVAGSGDTGVMALGVRADTAAATAANADYVPILMDSIGRVWITGADVEDAVATAGGSLLMMGCVRQDTAASSSGTSGDNSNCTTDALGRLWVNPFPASPAASTYLTVRLSDGSSFLTPSSDSTHDSAIGTTGPAVMLEASTAMTSDTAVADGDAVRAKADTNGRQVTVTGCARQDRVRGQATITDGSSTSVLAAIGANIIAEIYEIEIANSSATDVTVDIRDGTAGSVLWTLMAPATTDTGGGNNRTFTVPLTFTANTAVAADPSAAASSIIVSVMGCRVL